ncbi:hypothetical protein CIG19_01370 [Enterobacterales bacterium CwR94]|nr:hypothetical protein CIG19_01370 [Enterobacterales bacterium CwR94]
MAVKEKRLGIMTYLDNNERMVEEFGWLHKSWIHSGCWQTADLVVVHHPALTAILPKEPGIILIPQMPFSEQDEDFNGYPYINSIACLSGPHIDSLIQRYAMVMRTDADVFLTAHLANFETLYPVHGRGNYYFMADFREKMLDFCKRHGVKHHHRFGCGHSIMASPALMIPFLQRQVYWARELVKDFGTDTANWGAWPGWYRGVISMYAAEIAANERWHEFLQNGRERILDMESSQSGFIDSLTLHIHATQQRVPFAKICLREGAYDNIDPDTLDTRRIDHYCQWIVLTPLDDIKKMHRYPW